MSAAPESADEFRDVRHAVAYILAGGWIAKDGNAWGHGGTFDPTEEFSRAEKLIDAGFIDIEHIQKFISRGLDRHGLG